MARELKGKVEIPPSLTVRQLAEILGISPIETIKQLMRNGVMASINQVIDYDTAAVVAVDLGFEPQLKAPRVGAGKGELIESANLQPRPPVVTIMGHVDHGKTTLLDAIRQTNVAAKEVGGITQHIGAYQVEVDGRRITFLDTPGHEAFTAMRARGTQVTDIAVLVVAADDGVMPQTVEAINHARAAEVPIVVAINKIDKPEANPERVMRQLAELGLVPEAWGGDVICVPISAKRKQGIEELLENILVVAEMAELKADPSQPASGTVLEAGIDKQRGPVATLLVQNGTLKVGDVLVVGETWGKVRALLNEWGKRLRKAEPATPVVVLGINGVPRAGDPFRVVSSEREARSILDRMSREMAAARAAPRIPTLTPEEEGRVKEVSVVLKTDVQGSIEPIKSSIEKLSTDRLRLKVIHAAAGSITESDILLALASKGIIIGFNTRVEPGARQLAESENVDIYLYDVIYKLIEGLSNALKGMVEPVYAEVTDGKAQVVAVFPAGGGLKKVAGVTVTEGKIALGAQARVYRNGEVITETRVKSLRRFKDAVNEVGAGMEAGIGLENFWNFQPGDIIETYHKERVG